MHKRRVVNWIFAGIFLFAVLIFTFAQSFLASIPKNVPTRYGITFSPLYAKQLGLDVQETMRALVEELGVRAIRLPVYWSDVEREQGVFDWSSNDALIRYAEQHDVKLTLAIGTKVPRWPECYVPDWAESLDYTNEDKHAREFIAQTVQRYKTSSAVERWQVENEPLFPFGLCTHQISLEELRARVDLVHALDDRPIQLTVSGELGPWKDLANMSDLLGISMYRKTWNSFFGYFVYPIGPEFYQLRAQLVAEDVGKVIVSELQAEPWFAQPLATYTLEESYNLFTTTEFESNIAFVKRSGVQEAYLWGAEWWFYLKTHGDDRLWNVAQTVFETK